MRTRSLVAAALVSAALITSIGFPKLSGADASPHRERDRPVQVNVLGPRAFENVGVANKDFAVDLDLRYPSLTTAGFTGVQLTGPGGHATAGPGLFGVGADDKVPGLVVLLSGTTAGSGKNLAGVFNLTTVGNRNRHSATIHDTWLVGAAAFGTGASKLTVAVVGDLNHNGVFDDAPNDVPDADHNGTVDARDLKAFGVASNIAVIPFTINPDAA
jgi:hypothetical protein